jgi:4-hydroxy-tetrahydrodipicolinate synthase
MTARADFAGIFPYLVSPIDSATGKVLERPLRKLVSHLIAEGVQGLSPLGSTGEFAYLDDAQRNEIIRIVMDETAGRVPVIPGVSAFSTLEALRRAEVCAKAGADGIVLMLQSFFPVPPAGVVGYFRTVAESIDIAVCLYSNPGLTADLSAAMVGELSHVPNILYYKDASTNTGKILSTLNQVGDRMKMFSASAHIPVLVFRLGGVGWMAGPACLMASQCVRLWELTQADRWDEAMELQRPLWRLNEVFQKYSLAACIKAGLQIQGFEVGDPIAPQQALGKDAVAEIAAALSILDGVKIPA